MKALLVLALLATAAHADAVRDQIFLAHVKVAVEEHHETCLDLLDQARDRGIADTTVVRVRERYDSYELSRYRGPARRVRVVRSRLADRTLRELRSTCALQARRHAVAQMQALVWNASKYPEVWREPCLEHWPKALAKGVLPSETYLGGRYGGEPTDVSLGTAFAMYCAGR